MTTRAPLPVIGIPADVRGVGNHPFHAVGATYVNAVPHGAWLRPGDGPTSLRVAPWREEPLALFTAFGDAARARAAARRTLDRTAEALGV